MAFLLQLKQVIFSLNFNTCIISNGDKGICRLGRQLCKIFKIDMNINSNLSQQVSRLLTEYLAHLRQSGLSSLSVAVYQTHARDFVKWLHGEFTPGGKLSKKRTKVAASEVVDQARQS